MRAVESLYRPGDATVLKGPDSTIVTISTMMESFDPVSVFRQISEDGEGFIFDGCSVEPEGGRFVYVGASDCERLVTGDGTAAGSIDPTTALRRRFESTSVDRSRSTRHPPFLTGAVGYFAYESIKHFEPSVADIPPDPSGFPESAFFFPGKHLAFDRDERTLHAYVHIEGTADENRVRQASRDAEALIDLARKAVDQPDFRMPVHHTANYQEGGPQNSDNRFSYHNMVNCSRSEIERGELIQVVLSQSVSQRTTATAIELYEELAKRNPSPYMFMLNFGEFALIGASPELMVRSRGRDVAMHPIAGTRARGATPGQDTALEADLLTNEKERAEHVMLVDLARNDLGRVCIPGTVRVDSFMDTERYSHVMHLVSRVKGSLNIEHDGLDAFVAGFPLGTLTGAPRLRAIELIAELEQIGRGPYCGGVGWFDANGDVDTGTIIRCITLKDGIARVQGGAGVVYDSDPEKEFLESTQKMKAQFAAIAAAERSRQKEDHPVSVNTDLISANGTAEQAL